MEKCKRQHPYPRFKPPKPKKQMKLNFMALRASSTVSASDHLDDDNVVLMDVVEATTAAKNEDIGTVETAENGEQPVLERDLELELKGILTHFTFLLPQDARVGRFQHILANFQEKNEKW